MSKLRVIHTFIESCQKCPNAAQKGNIIYCVKERKQICEFEEFNIFIKKQQFPEFCKLIEIEETIITEREHEQINEESNKQLQ